MVNHTRSVTPPEQIEQIFRPHALPSLGPQRVPSPASTDKQVQESLELLEHVGPETSIPTSHVPARAGGPRKHHSMLTVEGGNMPNTVFNFNPQISKSVEPVNTRNKKPDLFFIFLDWEFGQRNPLPSNDVFRDSSLNEFFALVCEKAERSIVDVDKLTILCQWTKQSPMTAYASMSDVAWEELKDMVLENFEVSRRIMTERQKFHVWVSCPEEVRTRTLRT